MEPPPTRRHETQGGGTGGGVLGELIAGISSSDISTANVLALAISTANEAH